MKIKVSLLLLLFNLQLQGQIVLERPDFSVGNFYYRIIVPGQEVELVPDPEGCVYYTGDIVVPDTVEYEGVVYNVTSIGEYVFYNAILNSIVLPKSIKSLSNNSFSRAEIRQDLLLPDSLRSIGECAFLGVGGVTNIFVPRKVENIGLKAFGTMLNLQNIYVDTLNQYYTSLDGVLYNKEKTKLISFPPAITGRYIIPTDTRIIGTCAFENCKINEIVIPNTVAILEEASFSVCVNLTKIHIPASVACIRGGVFRGCKNLRDFSIDTLNSNYKIVDNVLYSINMDTLHSHHLASDSVCVVNGVKIIGVDAFAATANLKVVVLPEGVEELQYGAFQSSNIRTIYLPQTLKSIGESAFWETRLLKKVNIPNSVNYLGNECFYGSGLTVVKMSDSVKIIPYNAFTYCFDLESYSGGASVERIEEYAFTYCSSLSGKIIFPNTLKVIESFAFFATALTEIEFTGMVDTIGSNSFERLLKLTLQNPEPPYLKGKIASSCNKIIIPCGATSAYMSDPNWSSYNYEEDCGGVEEIDPQSTVQVVAQHHAIEVHNAEEYAVAIYDVMGRCHAAEPATGQSLRHYPLPTAGVYVVHINGKGYKVVVR